MEIILKNGDKVELAEGKSVLDLANKLSSSLAKKSVCALINDELKDLDTLLNDGDKVSIITTDDKEAYSVLQHSAAHIMAQAILRLYPGTMFEYGPALEEGFYYDVKLPDGITLNDSDFPKIEKMIQKIADENLKVTHKVVAKEEALEIFKDQYFKKIHIEELDGETLTVYQQGEFVDLCRGPHVPSTKFLKNVKLTAISGAYFKADKNNPMLTRVYGTAQFSAEKLKEFLDMIEQRKLSDHRRIGQQLGLFMISDYGPGFPFWLPNGMILKNELTSWWYDIHTKYGYKFLQTPIILNKELWITSGHWMNYKENMYTTSIDEEDFAIKPMNCPGGMLSYKHDIHSYKELPIRLGELGLVHRHEASGALSGLFRVRTFTQDDAHIFCTPEQLESEITTLLQLFDHIYKVFDLPYHIVLSTRPENKYIGTIEEWDHNEEILENCLKKNKVNYTINKGDGAFYGPKLDFKLKDSLNRTWQCGTIQLDSLLPERFDCNYINANGEKVRPVMLHRAIFGSLERFIGVITEHFKGAFPTWLAPKQAVIIPVNSDSHSQMKFSNKVLKALEKKNIRVSVDSRNEKMGYRIREAQVSKIPYQIIIGDNEANSNQISYRLYGSQKTHTLALNDFVKLIAKDIKDKQTYRKD